MLVDVMLKGMDGSQIACHLKYDCPGARVVALTAKYTAAVIRVMRMAGARACVDKSAGCRRILQAVRGRAPSGSLR